ncbi:hypothetical protein A5662_04955 [Mycobacteriaceae bacterium 1482268.1]|nr:hypothetical protein A5662_04955 [Mycobacteriaceae bacterium 1482268.1]
MTTQDTHSRPSRRLTLVNWGLALSTIIGAVLVEGYAFAQVMGTAGCSDRICPHDGPGDFIFGLIMYGTPVVALATIVLAIFTARKPRGWVAPVIAWVLFIIAFLILVVTFRG